MFVLTFLSVILKGALLIGLLVILTVSGFFDSGFGRWLGLLSSGVLFGISLLLFLGTLFMADDHPDKNFSNGFYGWIAIITGVAFFWVYVQ